MQPTAFKYCPFCRTVLSTGMRGGLLRKFCPTCDWIHYLNPTAGVAVMVIEADQILLGRRKRVGKWCVPCGHVEWNESIEEAARRELLEETGLTVELSDVYAIKSNFHDPNQHTVGVWYRGSRVAGELTAGGDLTDVAYFPLDRLPTLAFKTDEEVLNLLAAKA